MTSDIRVEGANKLGVLSAKLKNADKSIQKSMRQRLRTAAKPIVEDVKRAAGEVSKTIPGSIVLEMKYSDKRAGAYIKAKRSKMPEGKQALPGLLERGSKGSGGKYIRHPVFARKGSSAWVNQPTHPYLAPTAEKHVDDVRRELTKILDDVERDLA